ncbi:MAG: hypothetical protein ACRC8S_09435 [Fimbriiglobus sp.]
MNAQIVRVVAYFRLLGQGWDQIAMCVGVPAINLEGLPVTNPSSWQAFNEEFIPVIERDAKFQAIAALKLQMKSTNEAMSQNAALGFLKYDMESKKLAVKQQQLKLQEEKARLAAEKLAAEIAAIPLEPPAPEPPIEEWEADDEILVPDEPESAEASTATPPVPESQPSPIPAAGQASPPSREPKKASPGSTTK